jgi:hypothetical protein
LPGGSIRRRFFPHLTDKFVQLRIHTGLRFNY